MPVWDTLDTTPYFSSLVTIDSDGLTASATNSLLTGTNQGLAMPIEGKSSDLWCVEIRCAVHGPTTFGIPTGDCIGVVSSPAICKTGGNSYGFIGGTGGAGASQQFGVGYRQDSGDINFDRLYLIGQQPLATWAPAWGDGDLVYLAMNFNTRTYWWRINDGPWLGSTNTGDPALGTGGINVGVIGNGEFWPAVSMGDGAEYIFNFGQNPFTHPAPAGFTAGWSNTSQAQFGSWLSNGIGGGIGPPECCCSPYLCPFNGTMLELQGNCSSTTLGVAFIYDSDGPGGGPGTLLARSAATGGGAGNTTYTLLSPLTVLKNHLYYIGVFITPNGPYCGITKSGGTTNDLWIDSTAVYPTPNPTFVQSLQTTDHLPMVARGFIDPVGEVRGFATVAGVSPVISAEAPQGRTTLQNVIPSYLYVQYDDDDNLQAMVEAYNSYAQAYIDWFNALNLPIYTSDPVSGSLLDWVATNLYGYPRPGIPFSGSAGEGPYNTWEFNSLTINGCTLGTESSWTLATDDIYRRCLTWQFYKGDGHQFSISWLKRRIMRFVNAPNGTDVPVGTMTFPISVTFTGPRAATITLANTPIAAIFKHLVNAGILELPFQIVWTVTLT